MGGSVEGLVGGGDGWGVEGGGSADVDVFVLVGG